MAPNVDLQSRRIAVTVLLTYFHHPILFVLNLIPANSLWHQNYGRGWNLHLLLQLLDLH